MVKLYVHGEYRLSDIPIVEIPYYILDKAKEWGKYMQEENKGSKTRWGGDYKDFKGIIAQWAVDKYLTDNNWKHDAGELYVKEQYGDKFDIKMCDEIWDVKCRGHWNEQYFYNIELMMGENEAPGFPGHKICDYYIFTTTDDDYKNVYILGAISYHRLWNEIKEIENPQHLTYPSAGSIRSRTLTPIQRHILKTS